MIIRKATKQDAESLKELYLYHLTKKPPAENQDLKVWAEMIDLFEKDNYYHLLVGEINGIIVSSVTLIIVRNLTHNIRPYAVIENVVTHSDYRGNHYATRLMNYASDIANSYECYKIMLLTSSKLESTLKFYENCGFNCKDKTAFIKWL